MCEIPKDYDEILNDYNYNEAEPGAVGLISPEDLKVEEVWIEGPISGRSYYAIPAINLVSSCEGYDPEFILCYLPNEQKYATWDCDHWVLHCFENIGWVDIKKNPIKFLNAQWSGDTDDITIFNNLESYKLVEGWPF